MALDKEASIRRRTSSGLGWRSHQELQYTAKLATDFHNHTTEDFSTPLSLHANGNGRFGTVHTFEDPSDNAEKDRALLLLELHELIPLEPKSIIEPKPSEFREYYGWIRHPEGDQPELQGIRVGPHHPPTSIPQQICFLTPEGTEAQMSATRALTLGLIDDFDEALTSLGEYSLEMARVHSEAQTIFQSGH